MMAMLNILGWACLALGIVVLLTLIATVLLFIAGRRIERAREKASMRAGVKPPKGADTIYRRL